MKIRGLGGLDGTGQGGAQAVKRMGMRGSCRAWLEFHLSFVYPNKTVKKETSLTPNVVSASQGSPGKHQQPQGQDENTGAGF